MAALAVLAGVVAGGCADQAPAAAPAAIAPARAAATYTVCLQPLGAHDASLIGPIRRGIEQAYGFRTRRLAARALPKAAWYPPRQRYRAPVLLDALHAELVAANADCDAVLAFTGADISMSKGAVPDWGVLGLASSNDRVGVVSSFRMRRDADRARLVARAVKVVIHELGHVIGLPHGNEGPTCIMNDAGGSVRTIDRASGPLCAGERATAQSLLGRALPDRQSLDWNAIAHGPD